VEQPQSTPKRLLADRFVSVAGPGTGLDGIEDGVEVAGGIRVLTGKLRPSTGICPGS
jgi:hypothetical protein